MDCVARSTAILGLLTEKIAELSGPAKESPAVRDRLSKLLDIVEEGAVELAMKLQRGECDEELVERIVDSFKEFPVLMRSLKEAEGRARGRITLRESVDIASLFIERYNEARRSLSESGAKNDGTQQY